MTVQQMRNTAKFTFFMFFLLAPLLNIFRFDLELGHFILFNQPWTINIDSILHGGGDSVDAAIKIFGRVLLPGIAFVAISFILIWKYGRIYCGWLCPHFSVVEIINDLMLKQLHRVTVWEKASKASRGVVPKVFIGIVAIGMAFIWAVALLTYLLNPQELRIDLINFNLGFGSAIFISAATIVFTADFLFARHIFCKFGCALGLFQSLIWMANNKAMVIKFDRKRAKACRECSLHLDDKPCDKACPMRLPTRNMKRAKFTCTQCGQCIAACSKVQDENPEGSLLSWVSGKPAMEVDRQAGKFAQEKCKEVEGEEKIKFVEIE
jgi:polyferredoxin